MKQTITDRVKLLIKENEELNQNRLASLLGAHRSVVNKWMVGDEHISARLVVRLLELMPEIDANWLIRGQTSTTTQGVTGDKNYTQQVTGNKNSLVNENGGKYANAQKEIEYLKEIITAKDEQIKLLNKIIDK